MIKDDVIIYIPAYNEGKITIRVISEVIRLKRNMNKGTAVRNLFNKTKEGVTDVMVTINGDG